MWCKNVGTSFFRFATIHAVDRQTERQSDGQTDRKAWQYRTSRYMQSHGKNHDSSKWLTNDDAVNKILTRCVVLS